jgi:hypothetical protein
LSPPSYYGKSQADTQIDFSPVSFTNPHPHQSSTKTYNLYTAKKEKTAGQGGKPSQQKARGKDKTNEKKKEGTKVLHAEELRSQPPIRPE